MKNRLTLAFFILLGGIAYGAYEYWEFTSEKVPLMEAEIQDLQRKYQQKQAEYNRLKEFAGNIEQVKQELRELNLQLEVALEHMPRTFNLSGLLRKLTMLAQNSGVELSTFRPAKTETRDGQFYATVTIDFDLRGTYTQCLVFFDQVSRLKRIVNIDTLKMQARDVASVSRSTGVMAETTGTIRTYRFVE